MQRGTLSTNAPIPIPPLRAGGAAVAEVAQSQPSRQPGGNQAR